MYTQGCGCGFGSESSSSLGSGSGAGTEPINEQMQEFISSEITCSPLEQTPVIFGLVKEEILEILDECLGAFYDEVMAMVRDHILSFCEFRAYGVTVFFREKDPISSRRWLAAVSYTHLRAHET